MTLKLLETPRLYLRSLTLQDTDDIYAYAKDPRASKYLPWAPHESYDDTYDFIKNHAFKKYDEDELEEPYGIVLKQENRVIGTVGCRWDKKEDSNMTMAMCLLMNSGAKV